MKKATKIGLTFTVLSIIVIIIAIVFMVMINNEKTIQENIVIIKNKYTDFSIDVVENYQVRSEIVAELNAFTVETYPEKHEALTTLLTTYNETMTSLNANVAILEDKCSIEYDDVQTNIFCDNYQQLYEAVNNVYIENLTNYNNQITTYNEISEEDYDLFTLVNKDYIDFNKDGAYDGKTTK